MNDTTDSTVFNLTTVELPDGFTAQEWAERQGLGTDCSTWEEVLLAAGIQKASPTQSAKIALERAIKRAKAKDINKRIKDEVVGEDRLREIITEVVNSRPPFKLSIADGKEVDLSSEHYNFTKLLTLVSLRLNSWLAGPAGSGKTTAAHRVANALKLPYYALSVGLQTGKHEFFGYYDANGHYVRTMFREAYENGGIFLIDEIDAGSPHVLTSINTATANSQAAFPDKMVTKHPDFILIACANTWGLGADAKYVGRLQIDAATLNRFVKLPWGYDEKIETAMSGGNKDWMKFILKVRRNAEKYHINVVASPRDTMFGAQLLANGISLEDAKKMTVFAGVTDEQRKLLEDGN